MVQVHEQFGFQAFDLLTKFFNLKHLQTSKKFSLICSAISEESGDKHTDGKTSRETYGHPSTLEEGYLYYQKF